MSGTDDSNSTSGVPDLRVAFRAFLDASATKNRDAAIEEVVAKIKATFLEQNPTFDWNDDVTKTYLAARLEQPLAAMFNSVVDTLGPYLDRLQLSLERIRALEEASRSLKPGPAQDALRAGVVLLHAHLEEFLRTLAVEILPQQDEAILDKIPLVGTKGRAEKFYLGKLVIHRGRTVDEVLRLSVEEHLNRETFNSTDEIARILEAMGFKNSEHLYDFALLGQLMKRRHQIVHQQDRDPDGGANAFLPQPMHSNDLIIWLGAVVNFISRVLDEVIAKRLPSIIEQAILASSTTQS